jgi:ribosomal protein S18 acetylase RimI-like enzyme
MTDRESVIEIASPHGDLRLRPERDSDRDFRYALFCDSRLPEWEPVRLQPALFEQLMQHQFHAQTVSYLNFFPKARFDIIELGAAPIGRIVVDRPGAMVHIVDQAIVPQMRNRGIGTAIMRNLMAEARAAGMPVRLKVASTNDPSMRLYARLGFAPIQEIPAYIEMEWTAGSR